MKELFVIYDDSVDVPDRIKTIIGKNHYGEVVLKRKSLFNHFKDILNESKIKYQIINMKSLNKLNEETKKKLDNKIIFHYFSNNQVNDIQDFILFLNKIVYTKNDLIIESQNFVGVVYSNSQRYLKFLEQYSFNSKCVNDLMLDHLSIHSCIDISVYQNLLYYITGGFDARYFNSISGDEYTVIKSSKDKKKMNMEYSYYYLLPDHLKKWMVMPYDYQEDNDKASYKMERMPMTDIAIRWTHGAVDTEEVKAILDKAFYFINERPKKNVNHNEYQKMTYKLYWDKLNQRITDLKNKKEYEKLSILIKSGTDYNNIDEIIADYQKIFNQAVTHDKANCLTIGHGDLFFANMLYSKELNMLKLIDPKGGLTKEELWMNPYYDIAKLSHSICGRYDFFNVDRYQIILNKNMKYELEINFDNDKYVDIFKDYLNKAGYDYKLVRIYEVSLFLSMLPLHIDNVHKVFGFLLNAINIMKEVKNV